MRVERLTIKGINRNIGAPDNDDGFCSELINLKPENGLKVVAKKAIKSANIPYKKVCLHKIGRTTNYIGLQDDATGVKVVHFNPQTGDKIYTFPAFPAGSDIDVVLLNNQVVISDSSSIKKYVYEFIRGEYKLSFDGLDFDVASTYHPTFTTSRHVKDLYASTELEYIAAMQSYVNQYKSEHKDYCEGAFLYAFTITLKDGTETGMYNLTAVNTQCAESPSTRSSFIELEAYIVKPYAEGKPIKTTFKFDNFFQKITLNIGANGNALTRFKDKISKVNLYVSRPVSKFKFNSDIEFIQNSWSADTAIKVDTVFNPTLIKDSGVEKELLYRQKSWSLDEFCAGLEYTLEFGGDIQTTGATMEVSQSSIERVGKMFAYNNRVHFYDSVVRLTPKLGQLCDPTIENYADTTIYVYLNTGIKDNILKYENVRIETVADEVFPSKRIIKLPDMVVFPDSRAYKMAITTDDASVGGMTSSAIVVPLASSPAYNYSYFFADSGTSLVDVMEVLNAELSDTYTESNVVNVTAAGNSMVFPVEHSYRFDGNITALSVATDAISDAQVGQWPVSVFTDNGIYALQQGSGAVLYSNIIPLTNDICSNPNTIQTRQGTAYISNGAVYLLAGRNTTKLSLPLEGDIDTYIQNNTSFLKCCGGSLYNVSDIISKVPFRTYVDGASLSWCANTNELIVSNPTYPYSYVYDFIYNCWHKAQGHYTMVEDNIMLSPVTLNSDSAVPATATATLSTIHIEKPKTFASVCYAAFDTTPSCSSGHTIALVIDGKQVASATFQQTTRANMIVSTLCQNIGYLEDYNGMIYSTTDLSAKTIEVYNVSTNSVLFSSTFIANNTTVEIPAKAIDRFVSIVVNGRTYSTQVREGSSVITILNDLAADINNGDYNVTASVYRNRLNLTARVPGKSGNNITISTYATDEDYIYFTTPTSTLIGGQDISLTPSEYKQMIDWSVDDDTKEVTFHLHTRPIHLGNKNVFKTVRQSLLNCIAELKGQQNLSLYLYASNDLVNWKCVCASQRKDCTISQITTDRVNKAYKYFVVMIGGTTSNKTQLSDIFISLQDVANSKPR